MFCALSMGLETQGNDDILNPADGVVESTQDDLSTLATDVISSVPENKESQRDAADEQYYKLGETDIESGDLQDVTDAIDTQDNITASKITILGGADQIFMSEAKGQAVLDAEIAKLEALKSSFSAPNAAMIDGLIKELTDTSKHTELANRPEHKRADGRSNLGNARLIAARIASGYTEILTTIKDKIATTGTDIQISYDIPWDKCVIGNSGNKLSDRKIHVDISLQFTDEPKKNEKPKDDKPKDNGDDWGDEKPKDDKPKDNGDDWGTGDEPKKKEEPKKNDERVDAPVVVPIQPKEQPITNEPPKGPEIEDGSLDIQYKSIVLKNANMPTGVERSVIRKRDTKKGEYKKTVPSPGYSFDNDYAEGDYVYDNAGTEIVIDTKNGSKTEIITFANGSTSIKDIKDKLEKEGRELVMVTPVSYIDKADAKTQGPCIVDGKIENAKITGYGLKGTINGKEEENKRGDNGAIVIMPDGTVKVLAIDMQNQSKTLNEITSKYNKKGHSVFPAPLLIHEGKKYANIYGQTDAAQQPSERKPYRIQGIDKNGKLVTQDYKESVPLKSVIKSNIAAGFKEMRYVDIRYSGYTKEGGFYDKSGTFYPYRGDPKGGVNTEFKYDDNWIKTHQADLENQKFDHTNVMVVSVPKKKEPPKEPVKVDQIPVTKIETPKTNNDERNDEPVKEPINTPVNTDERADTPVKEKVSPVEETPTVNVEAPIELTPAFIDITKITPEQKIRLQNSVIGVKPDELIAKVNNMDDKGLRMQIIDQLLFVDGGAYGAMRLLGMVDNALTPMNKIPSHRKIDATVLAKFERKNRVYREYENVLFNKKLISNEFGQKALIPEDVKSAYKMFAYKALSDRYREDFTSRVTKPGREIKNSGKNYAIVSKTDGHVYLFDSKHALVSRKAAIMGKDRSNTPYDVKNYTNTSEIPDRTPAGLYTIGNNSYVDGNLGFFMTLEPKDGQITYRTHKSGPDAGKYARAIGFHKIYEPLKDTRNVALKSDDPSARFTTNGCINIDTYSYSELYDHLAKNAAVYITA